MNFVSYLASYTTVKWKWIKVQNVKLKTVKLIEENLRKLCDLEHSKDFLDIVPKA